MEIDIVRLNKLYNLGCYNLSDEQKDNIKILKILSSFKNKKLINYLYNTFFITKLDIITIDDINNFSINYKGENIEYVRQYKHLSRNLYKENFHIVKNKYNEYIFIYDKKLKCIHVSIKYFNILYYNYNVHSHDIDNIFKNYMSLYHNESNVYIDYF